MKAYPNSHRILNHTRYCAINIVGPPHIYPRWGDFTDATVFVYQSPHAPYPQRTYGPWWTYAPSAPSRIWRPASFLRFSFVSHTHSSPGCDFIDVAFAEALVPTKVSFPFLFLCLRGVFQVLTCKVSVYETYNCGSVVRIWACAEGLTCTFDSTTINS